MAAEPGTKFQASDAPAAPTDATASRRERALQAIAENPTWYHSIELAPGVVTPGRVDMRAAAERVLPDDLSGRRALDIGTFDGFWAFEMERRGAEVVAIDVERVDAAEWPPRNRARLLAEVDRHQLELGRGFRLAAGLLDSTVERRICSVYDLGPEAIGGGVDFVFMGALLLHLRDPVQALENVRASLRPGGELRSMEPFDLGLTARSPRAPAARFQPLETPFNWWLGNIAILRDWPRAAGFGRPRLLRVLRPPSVQQMRQPYAVHSCPRDP